MEPLDSITHSKKPSEWGRLLALHFNYPHKEVVGYVSFASPKLNDNQVDFNEIVREILDNKDTLVYLDFSGTKLSEGNFAYIETMARIYLPNLRAINLSNCGMTSKVYCYIAMLSRLPNIEFINLRGNNFGGTYLFTVNIRKLYSERAAILDSLLAKLIFANSPYQVSSEYYTVEWFDNHHNYDEFVAQFEMPLVKCAAKV